MSSPRLTSGFYATIGGGQCPICRSEDIEGGNVTVETGGAWQTCSCNNCDHSWDDVYVLTGYTDLKNKDGNRIEHS